MVDWGPYASLFVNQGIKAICYSSSKPSKRKQNLCTDVGPPDADTAVVRAASLQWIDSLLQSLATLPAVQDSVIVHLITSFGREGLPFDALEGGGRLLTPNSHQGLLLCAIVCIFWTGPSM